MDGQIWTGAYDLIVAGSPPSGVLGTSTSGTIDGYAASLAVQGNDLVLTVVPEPSTLALLVASAVGLAGYTWRRSVAGTGLDHTPPYAFLPPWTLENNSRNGPS